MKRYMFLALLLVLGNTLAEAPSLDLSYAVTPASINPGGSAQVIVTVQNLEAAAEIDDVTIRLSSRGGGVYATSSRADLGTISALSRSSGAFAIKAYESAAPGSYIMEASGEYTYGSQSGSFKLSIPVTVSYRSNLEIFASDAQITSGGTESLPITLRNFGKSAIRDVMVELSPGQPGVLSAGGVYPVGDVRKSLGQIAAGESAEVRFRVRASDSAALGVNPMTITVAYTDAAGATQEEAQLIAVNIVDAGTEVVIDYIKSNLEPGKPGSVKVGIRNVGETKLENLYLSISAGEGLDVSGSNERMLNSLGVGEVGEVEFKFNVDSDAEAKPVASTLAIKYQREGSKKEISDLKSIGIEVNGAVELRIVKVDVSRVDQKIEVDLANYGSRSADAVKVEILQDGKVFGTGFTDTIKPNKHKVFRFDMPSSTQITVRTAYKDYDAANGIKVNEEAVILEKSAISPPAGDGSWAIIVLAVATVLIFWYIRRRNREKQRIDISKYK